VESWLLRVCAALEFVACGWRWEWRDAPLRAGEFGVWAVGSLGFAGATRRPESRPIHSSSASSAKPGRSGGRTTKGASRSSGVWAKTPRIAEQGPIESPRGWPGSRPGLSGPVPVIPALSTLKAHEPGSFFLRFCMKVCGAVAPCPKVELVKCLYVHCIIDIGCRLLLVSCPLFPH